MREVIVHSLFSFIHSFYKYVWVPIVHKGPVLGSQLASEKWRNEKFKNFLLGCFSD